MKNKAIFLDRDGVLIEDSHLLVSKSEVVSIPGVQQALFDLRKEGYLLFILSNQSVVARGLLSEEECENLHAWIEQEILGINEEIQERYLCPFHPEGQVEQYRREHDWRKPRSGALDYWKLKYNIDMSRSYMLGDRESDLSCAQTAKCQGVLIGDRFVESEKAELYFSNISDFVDYLKNE